MSRSALLLISSAALGTLMAGCSIYNGVIDDVLLVLENKETCEPAPAGACAEFANDTGELLGLDAFSCTSVFLCRTYTGDRERCAELNNTDLCNCENTALEPMCSPDFVNASVNAGAPPTARSNVDAASGCACLLYNDLHYPVWPVRTSDANGSASADFVLNQEAGTVFDRHTGLLWQAGFAETDLNYTQAEDFCRSLTLDGFEDWRLPTTPELHSLVNYRKARPASDFPEMRPEVGLWARGTVIDISGRSPVVHMAEGFIFNNSIDVGSAVKCVRNPAFFQQKPLEIAEETVSDLNSGLMWRRAPSDAFFPATPAANQACEDLVLAGFDDWRLPSIEELNTQIASLTELLPGPFLLSNVHLEGHFFRTTSTSVLNPFAFWAIGPSLYGPVGSDLQDGFALCVRSL